MSQFGQKVVAVIDTTSAFGVTIKALKENVDTLTGQMSVLLDDSPEALDTLKEIAAAIADDPVFFTTMATANATLQANIDALSTAASTARTALQTALEATIDAEALTSTNARGVLAVRLDTLETDPTTAAALTAVADAATAARVVLQAAIDAVQTDVDANETASDAAEAALSGRLDTLEADPTTAAAVATVQADVDANEAASDAAETALSGRLDTLEADPTTKTYVDAQVSNLIDAAPGALDTLNELAAALNDDADFATTITNSIAAVQADVNQNETDADAAIAVVQADVDANEVTAAALVSAENTVMLAAVAVVQADVDQNETDADAAIAAVQADVDQNESDADTAIALKANKAGDTFTGDILLKNPTGSAVALRLSRADHADMSTEWKITPSYVSSTKECLSVLAAGQPVLHFDERQRVSINKTDPDYTLDVGGDGKFSTGLTVGGLTDAADDSAAATAGVAVNQLYRNGSIVMIRVS